MRLALFIIATTLLADDFSGTWIGQFPTRNGETQDIAFQFSQDGAKLTGKLYGDYRSTPIVEGRISGNVLAFATASQEQAGNQINETRFRFSGRLTEGKIELTRERETAKNAGNGGNVQFKGSTRVTFTLKQIIRK